jgi:hypothetical protein
MRKQIISLPGIKQNQAPAQDFGGGSQDTLADKG